MEINWIERGRETPEPSLQLLRVQTRPGLKFFQWLFREKKKTKPNSIPNLAWIRVDAISVQILWHNKDRVVLGGISSFSELAGSFCCLLFGYNRQKCCITYMQVKEPTSSPALKSSISHQTEHLLCLDKLWGDFWGGPVQSQELDSMI